MLYIAICQDKPDAGDIRANTRPDHLAWLERNAEKVKLGGPLTSEDGSISVGSMIIVEDETLEGARAFFAEDPYANAGLFASVAVVPFRATVGTKL
ncbi:YciI family protein [Amorphus orientalis]|uniref:Uncharacterized protein YciI n=1 Tax=Amorphus orientalis TaxID=649198 RepID=A0AAE4ATP7_9HYPH|nr:YciI family protein [Amorphus orientalis]MDQ0315179.1 uncharacterized protein YciI [Amorphus orientalis]